MAACRRTVPATLRLHCREHYGVADDVTYGAVTGRMSTFEAREAELRQQIQTVRQQPR